LFIFYEHYTNKLTAIPNLTVWHDISPVCGWLLIDWFVETDSFWTESAIDIPSAISDVMFSDAFRHTNRNYLHTVHTYFNKFKEFIILIDG
jgi:hypothetical protein